MVQHNCIPVPFHPYLLRFPFCLHSRIQMKLVDVMPSMFTSFGSFANICSSWSSSMHYLSLNTSIHPCSISTDSSSMMCFLLSPFSIVSNPAMQWSPLRNYSCVSYITNEHWCCFLDLFCWTHWAPKVFCCIYSFASRIC